jgi:hypothetical protein
LGIIRGLITTGDSCLIIVLCNKTRQCLSTFQSGLQLQDEITGQDERINWSNSVPSKIYQSSTWVNRRHTMKV